MSILIHTLLSKSSTDTFAYMKCIMNPQKINPKIENSSAIDFIRKLSALLATVSTGVIVGAIVTLDWGGKFEKGLVGLNDVVG